DSMLRFRRTSAHFWAATILVAMLGSVFVPLFGGLHADLDIVCADDAWGAHHQTTQVEGVRPDVGDNHCAVCHLQRAMARAVDDAKRFVARTDTAVLHTAVVARSARSSDARTLASRGPPRLL